MRRICIVVGSRANYSSIKSVMTAVSRHPDLEIKIVAAASALLDRYGTVSRVIEADGFTIDARVNMLVEGETLLTMAQSTGLGLLGLAPVLDQLEPDVVVTVGDRFETMATALGAAYLNIPLAHTMGGEVSGTIDESIRHAVTKFAHLHFPASQDARERIIRLGEPETSVHLVGCPRIDLVADVLETHSRGVPEDLFVPGVGEVVDIDRPFVMVSQHPVTTEYGQGIKQITATLEAVEEIGLPAIVLWPNADAGSEDVARGIRKWREQGRDRGMHFVKNLTPATYIRLMAKTACLVGNSSSGIREGAFIGTPTVNVGTRQDGRQRGTNVADAFNDRGAIVAAMKKQIDHGRYGMEPVYGDGNAGTRIAGILTSAKLTVQKRMTY